MEWSLSRMTSRAYVMSSGSLVFWAAKVVLSSRARSRRRGTSPTSTRTIPHRTELPILWKEWMVWYHQRPAFLISISERAISKAQFPRASCCISNKGHQNTAQALNAKCKPSKILPSKWMEKALSILAMFIRTLIEDNQTSKLCLPAARERWITSRVQCTMPTSQWEHFKTSKSL